ncbi:MAG: hypothetical protein ACFBRM_14555 [Pikeienuella sp.]
MSVALRRSESTFAHIACEMAPLLSRPVPAPEIEGIYSVAVKVVQGLAFAADWGARMNEIDRRRAMDSAERPARGSSADALVREVYWFELAR